MSRGVPFGPIRFCVGALVFWGDEVALLRRERPVSVLFTSPGGNVEPGEDLPVALTRELEEGPALPPGRHTRPSSSGSPTSASPARGRPRRRASSLPSTASTTDALRAGLPAVTDGSYTWV